MGSWGYAPMSNDTSEDIRDEFETKLKYKKDFDTVIEEILIENENILSDEDEASNLWISLAERQWQYGFNNIQIDDMVEKICLEGLGQNVWKEAGEKEYQKRMIALKKFYDKIKIPKEKSKKLPKLIIRKAIFKTGDCLAIKIDGYYACALVLDEDNSNIEYGENTIALLECYSKTLPTLNLYYETPYLRYSLHDYNIGETILCTYLMQGFQKFKTKILKIGNIDITPRKFTPSSLNSSCGWILLLEQAKDEFKNEFLV